MNMNDNERSLLAENERLTEELQTLRKRHSDSRKAGETILRLRAELAEVQRQRRNAVDLMQVAWSESERLTDELARMDTAMGRIYGLSSGCSDEQGLSTEEALALALYIANAALSGE